ncbi:ComEC/Rec2 family competence protein [Methylobacterium radiodurans]|uniref:Metallo-beta-lactamase domain-containing protein n=1 Tax=Methylobacterium radiodurans TaxID=2202828 RepID=A0A2U8VVF1_9HYPH|nr:MBL fold metallo-hydrolase [Methylobacterium radiodurans]AWN37685.1 hypothetical protein DK427_19760 [Methylobacterium radiodurans]
MVIFEALDAAHGDCFLIHFDDADGRRRLWLVDAGPPSTYPERLSPRIEQLRGGRTLRVDLCMVTHIDDDHIGGVLALVRRESRLVLEERVDGTVDLKEVWFNSFDDIVGAAKRVGRAAPADILDAHRAATAEVASFQQGSELRRTLSALRVPMNASVPGGLISAPTTLRELAGAKVTVLAPLKARLDALRDKWAKAAAKPRGARPAELAGLFREDLDTSVPNLSSIVAMVEAGGKRILLTGDARGDDIVAGWQAARQGSDHPFLVDVMKVPHHGSDRGITEGFLRQFPARHYVISANGRDGNPKPAVLEQIAYTQEGRPCTIHVTNDLPHVRAAMATIQGRPGNRIAYRARDAAVDPLSLRIEL